VNLIQPQSSRDDPSAQRRLIAYVRTIRQYLFKSVTQYYPHHSILCFQPSDTKVFCLSRSCRFDRSETVSPQTLRRSLLFNLNHIILPNLSRQPRNLHLPRTYNCTYEPTSDSDSPHPSTYNPPTQTQWPKVANLNMILTSPADNLLPEEWQQPHSKAIKERQLYKQ
jgi:hypothetical protein